MSLLGIEIGGTKLQIVRGDDTANIVERHRLVVDRIQGAAGIQHQIQTTIKAMLPGGSFKAIGVGFGGPVDWKTGRICKSHQIEGWSEFDFVKWLGKTLDAPVIVDNDANVAALGEALRGAGRAFNPVFYVTLGSGVGGGLVLNGNVYHGASPGESEIGHVRLDRSGTILESRCSGWAVDEKIRKAVAANPSGPLSKLIGTTAGGEARHLAAAIQQGDTIASTLLNEVADDLAYGLSHVIHLFHPQTIVLGGGLALVGEPLRSAVEKAMQNYIMKAFLPGPRVRLAELGEDTVPVGALEMARMNLLSH